MSSSPPSIATNRSLITAFFFLLCLKVTHMISGKCNNTVPAVTIRVYFYGRFSFQCESSQLSTAVGLRAGVQPSMWMHLRPRPGVSRPTT